MENSNKINKKDLEVPSNPFPIMPVGISSRSPSTASVTSNITGDGNVRVSPESRSEAGLLTRCMTCSYKAPEQSFMSKNKMIFSGCPECGEIDRGKMVYINEDGIKVPNEAHGEPKDFSKFVNNQPKSYGKPKPVEHQLRQNFI